MTSNKYDVFISFAEPNRELAISLGALMTAVGLRCWFAPKNLPKESPRDWQSGILEEGLDQSRCFLPILSPESLQRQWVLFEAGAAAALKLDFFVSHVDGVSKEDIGKFPYTHHIFHYKLFNEDDLRHLLVNLKKNKDQRDANVEQVTRKIDSVFAERRELVNEVLCQAHRRWTFIAGSIPKPAKAKTRLSSDQISDFVASLSCGLIQSGFNISACPQVDEVGKSALIAAEEWVANGGICPATGCDVDYEIAGLYPIDRDLRMTTLKDQRIQTRWKQHLLEFRKSYLSNKDWLFIVGGNDGTIEEFQAIEELNENRIHKIKVCFVTCFGGAAKKLWNSHGKKQRGLYFDGCSGWRRNNDIDGLVSNILSVVSKADFG